MKPYFWIIVGASAAVLLLASCRAQRAGEGESETKSLTEGADPATEPKSPAGSDETASAAKATAAPAERTLFRLFVSRNGSIAFPFFEITLETDGYVLTVNGETSCPMDDADAAAIMQVFAAYDLADWDGFSESNEGVLDGEGFLLEIELTDGTSAHASGSNAFPPRYHEAMGALWNILEHASGWPTD